MSSVRSTRTSEKARFMIVGPSAVCRRMCVPATGLRSDAAGSTSEAMRTASMSRRLTIVVSGWPRFQPTRVSARFRHSTRSRFRRSLQCFTNGMPFRRLRLTRTRFTSISGAGFGPAFGVAAGDRLAAGGGGGAGAAAPGGLAFGLGGVAAGFAIGVAAASRAAAGGAALAGGGAAALGAARGFLAAARGDGAARAGGGSSASSMISGGASMRSTAGPPRGGFAQHERAVLLAVGVVVERGGGRPRRRLVRRPERVGAPVRRHDGDARLAHREGPVGAVVEQARAAVRPADVVRADVEPAVHGVADGAEAQAPAGTSRTLGRLRAALGGAHVRRCWGSPAAVCASLDNSGATPC